MSKASCCAVNCSNSRKNSKCLLFKFPISEAKKRQRQLWIAAVKRENADGCDQSTHSHVEIQTDIFIKQKYTSDQGVGTDFSETTQCDVEFGFRGAQSISQEKHLLDLAGVSTDTFNTLLALSALFLIDKNTVSLIFFQKLEHLVYATKDFICWPSRDVVQDTTPKRFKDKYSKTRVIIDCTEFRMDIPSQIDERVWCYSHYKHGFTIKLLVCITPEEGDVVLADKGFPEIKTVIDVSGKKVSLVMPPFLRDKKEFAKEEVEETYHIASVRVHVERIMQRSRIYKVLDKIPTYLFPLI
ncbi:hypothetical protein QAD02_010532 [Eretmocerus hayati]|uniref:Uncharacterized protein n=1 Tax=Eretmocerus hayati TaxID=131215 RepID=A0ACC2NVE2_9HYME|nr:hypothetical protein QAD02_010532 [Eretmocerus hayati]